MERSVVDAKHIIQHLDEEKPEGVENESVEQLAFADKVLLNKVCEFQIHVCNESRFFFLKVMYHVLWIRISYIQIKIFYFSSCMWQTT